MENNILKHRLAVQQNIQKGFNSDLGVETFDDIEKGKWNVGDTKVYQGVTYEVGGFNANGAPLWRKAKGGAGSGASSSQNNSTSASSSANKNNSSIQSKNQQTVSANNSSTAQKNSNDVKKLNIDIDSDKIGSLLATFYQYGTKEDYQKKLQALQVLIDPSSNKEFWDHAFKVAQEKINKKDDGQSTNNNAVKQPAPAVNSSVSTNNSSDKTSNKKDKFVDKVMSVVDEFGSYYPFSDFSKEKVEKIISDNISESKEFLSFKFPSGGSVSKAFYHNADQKTYNLQGSDLTFETDKSYNTTSRYAGHLGTITTHYYIYYRGKRMAFSSSSTGSKWGSSPTEAKKECLYSGLIKYLS